MTTINNIADLAAILRDNPAWRESIRALLLSQELLELPEAFAQLTSQASQLTQRVDTLTHEMVTLTQRVDRFAEHVDTRFNDIDARFDGVDTRFDDIDARFDGVDTRFDDIDARFDGVDTRFDDIDYRLDNLQNTVNGLRGDTMEIRAPKSILPAIIQSLGLRRPQVMHSATVSMPVDLMDVLHDAEEAQLIPARADSEVMAADLIIQAQSRAHRLPVWIVAEVSATIDEHDIARARSRADYLAAATSQSTIPIVTGEAIDPRDRAKAESEGVTVIMV